MEAKKQNTLRGGLQALMNGGNNEEQGAAVTPVGQTPDAPSEEATATESTEPIEERATRKEEEDLLASIEDQELQAALRARRMLHRGRPRKDNPLSVTQNDLYTRTTLIVSREQMAKLREICIRETITLKEIIEGLIAEALETYEKKHGEIRVTSHKGDVKAIFGKQDKH